MNEAYKILKKLSKFAGNWHHYSNAEVWNLYVNSERKTSEYSVELRKSLKELLEAAERGGINEK